MYVITHANGGLIYGFGLTPKKAEAHYVRNTYDAYGDAPRAFPCSPALYRRLKFMAKAPNYFQHVACRINRRGVAVLPRGRPITRRKG